MKILKPLDTTTKNVDTFEQLQGVTGLIESVRQFHQSYMSGIMSSSTSLHCQKLIVENYIATLKDDNPKFLEANVDEFHAWVLDRATNIERVTDSIADTSDATSFDERFERLEGVTILIDEIRTIVEAIALATISELESLKLTRLAFDAYFQKLQGEDIEYVKENEELFTTWVYMKQYKKTNECTANNTANNTFRSCN
jgi:hypothetical protein